jgi:hypothetical protein
MSVVGVVAAGAGGLEELRGRLVEPLLERGHQVAISLTPTAASWFAVDEIAELERLTGLPVRSTPRRPAEERPHPVIEQFVAAPLSANSVAKLALGIGDNQAMSVLSEGLGSVPMVVFPAVNAAHARHPAWAGHLATLRKAGVSLVEWDLQEPRVEGRQLPWDSILACLDSTVSRY